MRSVINGSFIGFVIVSVLLAACGGGGGGGAAGSGLPVLAPAAFAAAFTEAGGPVVVAPTITVANAGGGTLISGTATIADVPDTGNEILAATPFGAIGAGDISYVAPVLTIAPAGGASLADFQAVLQSVTYNNTLAPPTEDHDRTILFMVNSAAGASNTATSTLTVTRALMTVRTSGFLVTGGSANPTPGFLTPVKVFDVETGALAHTLNSPINANGMTFDTGPRVAVGDFDGDGRRDEVAVLGSRVGGDDRPQINLYDMSLFGVLSEHAAQGNLLPLSNAFVGNGFVAAADLDGDGDDDLVVTHFDGVEVTVQTLLNDGQGANYSFAAGASALFSAQGEGRVGAGDIDYDGNAEIVVVAASDQGASVNVFDPVLDGAGLITDMGAQAEFHEQFGIFDYMGGGSVGIGEFAADVRGKELVLGSDAHGHAQVVSVVDPSTGGIDTSIPVPLGSVLHPFGGGYMGAVRVSVGTSVDSVLVADVIVFGQDSGQVRTAQRDYLSNIANVIVQDPTPPFKFGASIAAYGSGTGASGALANPLLGFRSPLRVDRGVDGRLNALMANTPNVPGNVDNSTGTVQNNTTQQFVLPNTSFAQPAGTIFDRFFVNVRFRTSDDLNANALNDMDVDLRVIQSDGTSIENFELFDAATLDDGTLRFTGQFGQVPVSRLAINSQEFGFFSPEGTAYNTVFTDLFSMATNELRLDVNNQNAEPGDVVVEHWEVFFLYAEPIVNAITAVDTVLESFTVPGDQTALFPAAHPFTVTGSTGNDGAYTVSGSVFMGGNTVITVNQDITDPTADGSTLSLAP